MIVPVDIRECVCFAYIRVRGENRAVGTGFFFGVPMPETDRFGCLVVTAMHVVARARSAADDGCIYLRVNTPNGGAQFVRIEDEEWVFPDQTDQAVDIALAVWRYSRDVFDFKFTTADHAATPAVLAEHVVGPGDEVFLPGLFVNHHGKQRNVPIVRMGNIASMPAEPVATKLGAIEAYLVEARSVGGLSGSPVFVQMGIVRPKSDKPDSELDFHFGKRTWYLLGVMHGHWQAQNAGVAVDDGLSTEYVNMGIAVVTPITKVLELLDGHRLKQIFEEMATATRLAATSLDQIPRE